MITLLVMTDGRDDLLARTLDSATDNLAGPITRVVVHDDTADTTHRGWVGNLHPSAEVIGGDTRRGFGGAIQAAWAHIADGPERFVFHLEDDFTFNRTVDLTAMIDALDAHPYLDQMALRRQPWNDAEWLAGGVIEQHPDDYTEATWRGHRWLEHRRFFTTNPSLYRTELCARGWPDGPESEGRFGLALTDEDPSARFAFWGARHDGPWVHHIGTDRAGVGY